MMNREQFGNYLLLKKLSEDALGESFRAGRLGQHGMQQVVLLRVFNGVALDGPALWQRISEGGEVQAALKSPHIGNGVDLGEVHQVPYAAYDYVSGQNLGSLFDQALRRNSPIPTDHALLIAERLALGLAVAYETRVRSQRILHGFLIPQLVVLSNEGEIRLLGFEAGRGLRDLVSRSHAWDELSCYFPPNAGDKGEVSESDDVYSLSVILLELLLGRHLPRNRQEVSPIDLIAEAANGSPAPPRVWDLLRRCLGPQGEPVANVVSWHKELSGILIESTHRSTAFNLAFFMHNLFRDEIEQETKEIEVEKNLDLPAVQEAETGPGRGEDETQATAGSMSATAARGGTPSHSRAPLWVALAAILTLAVGGTAAWYYWQGRNPGQETAAQEGAYPPAAFQPQTPIPQDTEPVALGPTPEELLARIDEMVAERAKEMEVTLRGEYDEEIKSLREQLQAARRTRSAPPQRADQNPARETKADPLPPAKPEPGPTVSTTEEPSSPPPREPEPALERPVTSRVEAARIASDLTSPSGDAELRRAATKPLPKKPEPVPAEPEPVPAEPEPVPAEPAKAPARAQEAPVRVGQMVEAGPGVELPKLRGKPEPRYPAMARKMRKEATVFIKVLVDETGSVVDAVLRQGQKPGFGFEGAALQAAKRAKFQPAVKNGVPVTMWTSLRVDFRLK